MTDTSELIKACEALLNYPGLDELLDETQLGEHETKVFGVRMTEMLALRTALSAVKKPGSEG